MLRACTATTEPCPARRHRLAACSRTGPCGEIGRRIRLKIERRKACWFESGQGHHIREIAVRWEQRGTPGNAVGCSSLDPLDNVLQMFSPQQPVGGMGNISAGDRVSAFSRRLRPMRTMPDGSRRPVKFDGIRGDYVIDRKWKFVTEAHARAQIVRQSDVSTQHRLIGVA